MPATLGVVVSAASWAFLELVYVIQRAVYEHTPSALGYEVAPWWWSILPLVLAGILDRCHRRRPVGIARLAG